MTTCGDTVQYPGTVKPNIVKPDRVNPMETGVANGKDLIILMCYRVNLNNENEFLTKHSTENEVYVF